MNCIKDETRCNKILPSDTSTATAFDRALASVVAKYRMGVALTRRELLRLSKACLMLIGREGNQ